jgi:hypothetical protein
MCVSSSCGMFFKLSQLFITILKDFFVGFCYGFHYIHKAKFFFEACENLVVACESDNDVEA